MSVGKPVGLPHTCNLPSPLYLCLSVHLCTPEHSSWPIQHFCAPSPILIACLAHLHLPFSTHCSSCTLLALFSTHASALHSLLNLCSTSHTPQSTFQTRAVLLWASTTHAASVIHTCTPFLTCTMPYVSSPSQTGLFTHPHAHFSTHVACIIFY